MALPEKPNLPDRLYYSIPKAVKKINSLFPEKDHIDEHDLLHFFLIGKLEICFHLVVNGASFDDEGDDLDTKPTLEFKPIENDDISEIIQFLNKYSDSRGREWIRTSYGEFSIDYDDEPCDPTNIKALFEALSSLVIDSADMFCALRRLHKMTSIDDLINNGLIISGAKIPRTTQLEWQHIFKQKN